MTTNIRKTIAWIVIAVMLCVSFAAVITTDSVSAAPSKSAISRMANKSKKGFKKFKGGWYYIQGHKVTKGLKKIKGKYYFFDKKGTMKSGAVKVKGKNYYFNKIKKGKKKGQAPALVNQARGKYANVYFYQANGVRYEYRYESSGNALGDTAAGMVISKAKITKSGTRQDRLEKAYRYILKTYDYGIRPRPKFDDGISWRYKCAYDMVMGMNTMGTKKANNYKGKCYNFAGVTCVVANALGYVADAQASHCLRPGAKDSIEHAWVTYTEGNKTFVLDSMWDHNEHKDGKGELGFFCKEIQINNDGSFTLNGYSYL